MNTNEKQEVFSISEVYEQLDKISKEIMKCTASSLLARQRLEEMEKEAG